jgi:hypothetical protein
LDIKERVDLIIAHRNGYYHLAFNQDDNVVFLV